MVKSASKRGQRKPAQKQRKTKKVVPYNSQKPIPQFVAANCDPFNEQVRGVKVPDQNSASSVAAFSLDRITIPADGTYGGAFRAFRYHPKNAVVGATSMASATTWNPTGAFLGGSAVSNTTALAQGYAALRCAAWGIRLNCRQSATTAQGVVHICQVPEVLDGATWSFPTSVSQMQTCGGYKRFDVAALTMKTHTEVGKFTDMTAFRYIDPNTADTSAPGIFSTTGWTSIIIAVEGATAGANVLDVDFIHHWEALPGPGAPVIPPSTAMAYSPAVLASTSFVQEHLSSANVINDVVSSKAFWADVYDLFNTGIAIANGVASGLEYVAPLFF